MKAILEFELPLEQEAFDLANRAPDYRNFISDFYQHIRNLHKYGLDSPPVVEEIYKKFFELLNENDIKV